jgi:hypothetical protein
MSSSTSASLSPTGLPMRGPDRQDSGCGIASGHGRPAIASAACWGAALRRWGAWIVVADGLVWLAEGLITREFAPTYWSASGLIDYISVAVHTAGLLLLTVGLAAIHEREAGQGDLLEPVGFVVASVGAALAGAGNFAEDGLRIAAAGWAFMSGMVVLAPGLLLFGFASLRARTLPAACGGLVLMSLVAGYPLGGLWGNWAGAVFLALVWITLGGLLMLYEPRAARNVVASR